jgi:hypothetical protein
MASDNVVILPVVTSLSLPPERILNAALEADLDTVLVLGYDKAGNFYFAGSEASGPENVWLCEMGKHKLIQITIDDE